MRVGEMRSQEPVLLRRRGGVQHAGGAPLLRTGSEMRQCVPKVPLPADTCDEGLTACTNIDGTSCCRTDSQKCSNGICVDNTTCRLKDAVVCHVAAGLLCCGPDQTCGSDECVDSSPNTCDPGTTFCGNIDGSACCAADQLCSAGVCVSKA